MSFRMVLFMLLSGLPLLSPGQESVPFQTKEGNVFFRSDAPLEIIEARSDKLQGAIDPVNNTFAFKLDISSFQGFNSPLQQVHFNENYMDSKRFPTAIFSGKIIEKVDLSMEGTYFIRTKGKLTVHGVTMERIIKSTIKVSDDELEIMSRFPVLLEEHDIEIPKVVHQKIAEEIIVEVEAVFKRS